MKRERWQRLRALFEEALGLPPPERDRWLREACAGDDELLREARGMLASNDETATVACARVRIEGSSFTSTVRHPAMRPAVTSRAWSPTIQHAVRSRSMSSAA